MQLKEKYYQEGSLQHTLEKLSGPHHPVDAPSLATLIAQYATVLVTEESPSTRLSYQDISHIANECEIDPNEHHCGGIIKDIHYQLRMLLDIPATMALMIDIINSDAAKRGQDFIGIDLGSGSGILMLAQYIHARRCKYQDMSITGIELNKHAVKASRKIIEGMGIGMIRSGDTTKRESYDFIKGKRPTIITNENLSTEGIPFRVKVNATTSTHEPFLENLWIIRELFGPNISDIQLLPFGLCWGDIFEQIKVPGKSQSFYGLDKMRMLAKIKKKEVAEIIYPTHIFTGGEWVELSEVGYQYHQYMQFNPGTRTVRWGKFDEQDLRRKRLANLK